MENKQMILIDTGVFFDYFEKDEVICQELDDIGFENILISSVSVAEVYFGMRSKEARKIKELIKKFNIYHLDKEVSIRFLELMLAHIDKRIAIPDALIASIALSANVKLYTLNRKDFNYIEGIKLYNPKNKISKIV